MDTIISRLFPYQYAIENDVAIKLMLNDANRDE